MRAAYVTWAGPSVRHYAARTRPAAHRARRRHHRRRWVLSAAQERRLFLAAMTDIDCPGFRAAYSRVGAA